MARLISPRGLRRPGRSLLLLLVLPILLVLAACEHDNSSSPHDGQPPFAPEPIGPRGAVESSFSFVWKAVPGGAWIYQVTVTDAAERVLFQREVRNSTTCPPTSDLKAMLAEQHGTFSWSVAIVAPEGRALVRSAPVSFSLK